MDSDADTSGKNKANEQKKILKGDEIQNNKLHMPKVLPCQNNK